MSDYRSRYNERKSKTNRDVGEYLEYLKDLERNGLTQYYCIAMNDFDECLWMLYSVPVIYNIGENIDTILKKIGRTHFNDISARLDLNFLSHLSAFPFSEYFIDAANFNRGGWPSQTGIHGGWGSHLDNIYVMDLARLKVLIPNLIQAISCWMEIGNHLMYTEDRSRGTPDDAIMHRCPTTWNLGRQESPWLNIIEDYACSEMPCSCHNKFPNRDIVITTLDSDGIIYNSELEASADPVAVSSSIARLIRILLTTHSIFRLRHKRYRQQIEFGAPLNLIDRPGDSVEDPRDIFGYSGPMIVNFPYLERRHDVIEVIDWNY